MGKLFATTDPHGRTTYRAYDACCGRLIRTVTGTVPQFTLAVGPNNAPFANVLGHTRAPDGTPNATSLVSDTVYDAAGQVVTAVDPRGTSTNYE